MSIAEIGKKYGPDGTNLAAGVNSQPNYVGWEASRMYGCVCDTGYYNPDCSARTCPRKHPALCGGNCGELCVFQVRALVATIPRPRGRSGGPSC
jgi:hypothetical protein